MALHDAPELPDVDALIEDLRTLVECESPSVDADALSRSADLVARLGTEHLGAEPERLGIHLRWRLGGPTRVLVLAHHDTVWPIGSLGTHPFGISDGVLRGPGSFDMKTGLAMALHVLGALDDRTGVTLLVTGDEELGSPSSQKLIEDEARGAEAALVLEASADGGALKLERKGTSIYRVVIKGRAAHAGLEPEKGVNASVELAHQALAVAALGDPALGTTVTPTDAVSGTTRNTVPADASFAVDVRARTVAEQQRVDTALRALAPVLTGAAVEIEGGINRPPLERALSADLFAKASRIAEAAGLPALTGVAVGGASDGNFTAGVGTPTLDGLGAVGGGAHADDEHVLVDRIVDRTALLQALITDLIKTP